MSGYLVHHSLNLDGFNVLGAPDEPSSSGLFFRFLAGGPYPAFLTWRASSSPFKSVLCFIYLFFHVFVICFFKFMYLYKYQLSLLIFFSMVFLKWSKIVLIYISRYNLYFAKSITPNSEKYCFNTLLH